MTKTCCVVLAFALLMSLRPLMAASWNGHAGDPQHTAISAVPSLPFDGIRWSTPVDVAPPGEPILIHYGSPMITQANTVLVPVKNGTNFRLDAIRGSDGTPLWNVATDFKTATLNSNWVPSFSPTLTPSGRLYYQGIGGTVYRVDNPDSGPGSPVQISFLPDYAANKAAYDNTVRISTPITSDDVGNIYFGYEVTAGAPGGLTSGIARIAPDNSSTFTSANAASGIGGATGLRMGTNSAPALSNDGTKVYIGLQTPSTTNDVLAAIDATTLAPLHRATLNGRISDAGTSSPTVGPDGDVYFGVLPGYHFRGTMQHFSGDLATSFAPGSFGWDITPSIVPASMIPAAFYSGTSEYLLLTKYNDYKEAGGGTGLNRLAILDPNATQFDPLLNGGQLVMKEVLAILGVTPDGVSPPGAVREWCINTMAVDPFSNSILANSEDGELYRWDLTTNTFSEIIELQSLGVLEAYTPTAIGPDGTVYAINKGVLFAVGIPEPSSSLLLAVGGAAFIRRLSSRRRLRRD